MSKPQTAVILAGGGAISDALVAAVRPKLLLPIANRPLIDYLASVLAAAGVKRLIICLDLASAQAAERLAETFVGSSLSVECVVQETPRGTGGSLKEAEGWLRDDSFWVASGDLFLKTDLRAMLSFHRQQGSFATVAAFRIQESPWEMERVELDLGRNVRAIHRIHPAQNRRSPLKPAGLYLFEPAVLDLIPRTGYFDLKEQLFPRLKEFGRPARVWEIPGYCRTVFSVGDYFAANRDVLLGQVRFSDMRLPPISVTSAPDDRVAPTATLLQPVVVGSRSRIGAGALIIGPTAIAENCEVEPNAILDQCVVLAGARVGQGAHIHHCILSERSIVEDGAVMREMVVNEKPEATVELAIPPETYMPFSSSGLMRPLAWPTSRRRLYLSAKRAFDIAFATLGLVTSTPLLALVALAIRLESPGAVIFRQRRCGQYGREFTMYKFRSMVANAEELKRVLVNEVDGPMFKITADPRITRVGSFLRATNLDELPQLWNVLRGDMSLVGPRPLSMDEMRYNPRWRDIRLSVRPGLTGLWQVEAHSKVSFADWIRWDLYYVPNLSPWLDLKILLKTGLMMFAPWRK
jgi:lipopolysaccharide/colanic/teichoic acid biosynthesis glycosyltransferase/NDP-sugar pyrophosphorylase family protein